jgi:hypothetical protein
MNEYGENEFAQIKAVRMSGTFARMSEIWRFGIYSKQKADTIRIRLCLKRAEKGMALKKFASKLRLENLA